MSLLGSTSHLGDRAPQKSVIQPQMSITLLLRKPTAGSSWASQISSTLLRDEVPGWFPKVPEPQLMSKELIMLTEVMKVWHGLVIAVVSLLLQACLLIVINYLLSRQIDGSDTSSDSSDSSCSSPPACQDTKDVDYTQVIFSAPEELKNDSALDYENIKEITDYVNVNPESHKPNFWYFVNPALSEPAEYNQVTM
ncbi:regulator of hemoglobinization and erythroid cell expansion protein isoform X2 [Macaca nemestrina]|nr:regulator of hemoglobinization and erythroid cell expansion protein isoform X2 [Macaca nemestrina]